jgi:hypothetical protein
MGSCETIKNISVSLDDETWRNARMKAAAMDTSVSALVKRYLTDLGSGETEFERLQRMKHELQQRIKGLSGADRFSRNEVHRRDA